MIEEKQNSSEENILERIKREITNFKNKKKALINELRQEFPNLLIPLMEQSEIIETISWSQYTPYFNDGEECTFSANTDCMEINGEDEDESNIYRELISVKIKDESGVERDRLICEEKGYKTRKKKIGEYGYKKNINFSKTETNILNQIKSVLKEIPDDFYRDLFGDHVKIEISKKGEINITEYEHD